MSDLEKTMRFNARMVEDLAAGLVDDIERGDYESPWLAIDDLMTYASRLMRNLEDADIERDSA